MLLRSGPQKKNMTEEAAAAALFFMKRQTKQSILTQEQRKKYTTHCSFFWDKEKRCSVLERIQRSISFFVQAVLNNLPVCLKATPGSLGLSCLGL